MSGMAATGQPAVRLLWAGLQRWWLTSTRSRYTDFLPEAQAIAAREASPLARLLIFAVVLLFITAVTWAGLAEVEQVATAAGVVRPAGKVKIVNHSEGGRIAAVLVKDGDRVEEGQRLIEFDAAAAHEEVTKRAGESQALGAEEARLMAEADDGPLDFPAALASERPDLVQTQTSLFESRHDALRARRAAADRVIEQRDREADGLSARLLQLKRGLAILREQERAVAQLAGKGYFPKLRHLSIKRQISDLEGQVAETGESAQAAVSALAEARSRRESVDTEWRSEVLSRLAELRREAAVTRSILAQEEGRLGNLVVRAPAGGIVQNLAVTAPGQAVAPNEPLLSIVPTGERLIIEARVSNDDIGYISPGQKATIKVQTYDFIRFGALAGVVEQVAADAVEDPRTGLRSFQVTVGAERTWLREGDHGAKVEVNPGMQVTVDLHVGERSILSYLTDRISRGAKSALRER